jgi:hypothetical protein
MRSRAWHYAGDRLRQIAQCRRLGVNDDKARRMVEMTPAAFDFACELLIVIEAEGLMNILGPLPDDRFDL